MKVLTAQNFYNNYNFLIVTIFVKTVVFQCLKDNDYNFHDLCVSNVLLPFDL